MLILIAVFLSVFVNDTMPRSTRNFLRLKVAVPLLGTLLAGVCTIAEAVELSGYLAAEMRTFLHVPAYQPQASHALSVSAAPEIYHSWNDGDDSFLLAPFVRFDSADSIRTHFDIREAMYLHVGKRWELRAGIGKVFWGVSESRHLTDIINQSDLIENVDGEDKLGQPMLNLRVKPTWGTLDFFVLPGFRERTFAGPYGRLRSEPFIDADAASYESSAAQKHIDYAIRWSEVFGEIDLGIAHFIGTSREPRLIVERSSNGHVRLRPHYDQIQQSSIDLQATVDVWLWKFEGILRSGQGTTHIAWVGGFEYSWYGLALGLGDDSVADVSVLVEHLFDGRGRHASQPFENDLFVGLRLALNDVQSSELLAGVIYDLGGEGQVFSVEASRRISDHWRIELESRFWSGIAVGDPQRTLRRDDYVGLRLRRYF